MSPRLYVDTSAYLCLLLGEEGADEVGKRLSGGRLLSSVLLVLESRRNLVRLARGGQLPAARLNELLDRVRLDAEAFTFRDLTADLCFDATMPVVSTPRSLDLAHLRTALWFHRQAPLDGYVTRDEVQQEVAREFGLPAT